MIEKLGILHLRKMLTSTFLCFAFAACLGAQSNDVIDRLLDEKPALVGDVAYVVLAAANIVTEESTADDATNVVTQRRLLSSIASPTQAVTLGQACYLIMETQGMKGGLLYTLFPGPRYASRELASLGMLKGNTHPGRTVSGEEVMWILGAVLNRRERANP